MFKIKAYISALFVIASSAQAKASATHHEFSSNLFQDGQGKGATTSLPWAQAAGMEEPIFIDAPKVRSKDSLIMLELNGSLVATGLSDTETLYERANRALLDKFAALPQWTIPKDFDKGVRFTCETSLRLKQENTFTPMSHWEVTGTIRIQTDRFVTDTFFMPRCRVVIKSTCEESPIEAVIFYLANNQLPMRLKGYIYFEKHPLVHLEAMNVGTIKIVHRYKNYAATLIPKVVDLSKKMERLPEEPKK
jgi:hypothetical protein